MPKAPKASKDERIKRVYKGVKQSLRDDTAGNLGSRPVQQYIEVRDKKLKEAASKVSGALKKSK